MTAPATSVSSQETVPTVPADTKTIRDPYGYIDGGADRYLRQGFRRLHAARYVNVATDEVTVDLYDLGQPKRPLAGLFRSR